MKKTLFFLLGTLSFSPILAQGTKVAPDSITSYIEIPLGSIKPKGWLLAQLQTMRDGSTGNLDDMHPKIGRK